MSKPLRIVMLSREPRNYSSRRLKEAARTRGHHVRVLDTLRFSMLLETEEPDIRYAGRRLGHVDAVVPRIGHSVTFYGTAVVRQFEQIGAFALNSANAIAISRDKLRSLQILSRHDIGMPPTAFAWRKQDIANAIDAVGGAPVVIKALEGTHGVGVVLADTRKMAEAVIEALHGARQSVLVQKFVAESKGRDIRALVVGGRVVAAMRRLASGQEFRSNIHRGGTSEAVKLDETYARTAVRAAHLMGLEVAGVDMLESDEGPQVMEVNSSPGLEGIERTTGIDVAGEIVRHLEEQRDFPEVDLRQRLSLRRGWTITELMVTPESELAGHTLAEAGLREREVVVLSITRGGIALPNPGGGVEILAGDVLTCFGRDVAMRALIPPVRPSRKKKRKKKVAPKA